MKLKTRISAKEIFFFNAAAVIPSEENGIVIKDVVRMM